MVVTGIAGGIVGGLGSATSRHRPAGLQWAWLRAQYSGRTLPMNEWQQAERHADRALDLFDRGFLEEAESELRKALEIQPDQADWQFNLGLTLEAAQRDQEAMEQFERAASLAPDQMYPNLALGSMAIRLGQWSKSLSAFDDAIAIDPTCEEAHAGRIESHAGAENHDEAETAFYLAEMAMEESSAQCLQAIAKSLIVRKSYPRAEWCLRESIRLAPASPEAPVQLAMLLADTDQAADALKIFSDLLRERADDVMILMASARLFVKLERFPEAMGRLENLLRIEPTNLEAHELLADLSLKSHHYDRAILEYQLVLRLHPMQLSSILGLADALIATRRFAETRKLLALALQQWDRFVDYSPSKAAAEADHLADLLLAAGLNLQAGVILQKCLKMGASVERWRRLAMARYRCGDLDAGMHASRAALRLEPDCLRSLHNLTLASLMLGRLNHAGVWLRRGLRRSPRDEGMRRLRIRYLAQRALRSIGIGRSTAAVQD